jgi:hypothetical protein
MIPSFCRAALTFALFTAPMMAQPPGPLFSPHDAETGKKLAAKSLEIRAQIKKVDGPAEPFKIMGNLYFVGPENGDCYLLTSPQGHILFGAGFPDSVDIVTKNIESLGFKMTDIKVIALNHSHVDSSGAVREMKKRTGAQVMAGFAEVPYIERGIHAPNPFAEPGGRTPRYPSAAVDRALFDGDVIQVGPLKATVYLFPGHAPSPASFVYTVRDGGKNYRVIEFCCWEYPDDLSRNGFINEASTRHSLERWHSLHPIDIYLENGAYGWGGTVLQPEGTFQERIAKLKADPKLFINRDYFRQISAAREAEFEEKLHTLKAIQQQ